MEVAEKSYYDSLDRNCYMHITLTDEEDIPDAVRKLQVIYPNLMKLIMTIKGRVEGNHLRMCRK